MANPDPPQTERPSAAAGGGSPLAIPASGSPDEYRRIWEDYNGRQEFEHTLIDRKTTWWITGQSILFAAYGVALPEDATASADFFRTVVASTGLAVAALAVVGAGALIRSKLLSWRDYRDFFEGIGNPLPGPLQGKRLEWGVRTANTRITLLPDFLLPIVFAVAWISLLVGG